MISKIFILPLILSLTACAATLPTSSVGTDIEKSQIINSQASRDGYAVVYIYRLSEFQNLLVDYLIGFDPSPVVTMVDASFTRIEIPPGHYKFIFATTPEDYNKPPEPYSYSGSKELEVRPDTVNIVHFDAYPGSFVDITYGVQKLSVLNELDYLIPTTPVVVSAKKLTTAVAIVAAVDTKKSTKALKVSALSLQRFDSLKLSASCELNNENWVYTGTECNDGLAHGLGTSEDKAGLKFVGEFQNGKRVKGEILQHDSMIFTGLLVEDKPHGPAICHHDGEYEECRFYKGKRIDTLYKIRKENAKTTKEIARLQKSKSNINANSTGLGDDLQNEMLNRAAGFIFDSLF